jgi:hypothetical protein
VSGSFSLLIGVLFSGVIALLVIATAYVFCVRPVLRRHGGNRGRGGVGASPDRNPELERQLGERPAELGALRAHDRHGIPADAERRP